MILNETMQSILARRSYKVFDDRKIGEEELETVNLLRKSHLVVTALRWLDCVFAHEMPVRFSSGLVRRLAGLCDGLESL